MPEGLGGPMRPLGTSCGGSMKGAQDAVGKKLGGTWVGSLGVWLVLLLGTEIRRRGEFAQSRKIPPPSSRAWC